MIKKLAVAAALTLVAVIASAQTNDSPAQNRYTPSATLPLGDTLLSLPTSHIPSEGVWEVKFTHRFNQSIDSGEGIHNLFGLDSNADVGLGLSYAPHRDFQLTLVRSNVNDDIELAGKYIVIQQAAAIPFSAALRAGTDLRTERDLEDRTSFFAQAILSHQFGRRAEVFVLPTYCTNAGRAAAGNRSTALFDHAFNVPVGIAVMIRQGLSVVGEVIPVNHDLPNGIDADFGWSLGLKRAIGGHYFEILLTNSGATQVDQYVTTTYQGAGLDRSDIRLGFNIERRFGK